MHIELIGLLLLARALAVSAENRKVLLSSVRTLTFYANRVTTSRRSSPIPQLVCVAGNACKHLTEEYISVMQCQNQGSDGVDAQWKCTVPDLPDWFRLGQTTVNCEGFDYPDDPYVLAGSCGVEYKAYLTQRGKEYFAGSQHEYATSRHSESNSIDFGFIILLLFFAYVIYLIFTSSHSSQGGSPTRQPREDNDPPPPYDDGFGGGQGGRFKNTHQRPRFGSSGVNVPGGFWTGMGLGGLLGFLGGRGTSRTYQHPSNRSSWFQTRPNMTYSPGGSSSATSFSASTSSGTRDATGYGGTRRR